MKKRKLLALADNAASDASSWNAELVRQDWNQATGSQWGLSQNIWEIQQPEAFQPQPIQQLNGPEDIENFDDSGLPEELKEIDLAPADLPRIEGDFKTECGRVIITFPWDRQNDVIRMLGITSLDKIVYSIEEIFGEK